MLTLLLTTWLLVTPILHEGPECVYYAYILANDNDFWIDQRSIGTDGCGQEWNTTDGGTVVITTPLYTITIFLPPDDITEGYIMYSSGQPYADYHRKNRPTKKIRVIVRLTQEI